MEFTPEERRAAFEKRWQLGGVLYSKTFPDQMTDMEANEEARKFYEEKIRAVIDDPAVADLLIPNDHPDRDQANLHRQQLLSDVQPAQCVAGQRARHPDRIG